MGHTRKIERLNKEIYSLEVASAIMNAGDYMVNADFDKKIVVKVLDDAIYKRKKQI